MSGDIPDQWNISDKITPKWKGTYESKQAYR
jgi:hypothetical protein